LNRVYTDVASNLRHSIEPKNNEHIKLREMKKKKSIEYYDNLTEKYDSFAINANYKSPNVIFDSLNKFNLNQFSSLLDIGIGTGLCSEKFSGIDLKITGIDGSKKLIEQCAKKKIADELIVADLSSGKIPIKNKKFDIILCSGLFEFIHKPNMFFEEIKRISSKNFILALAVRTKELNSHLKTIKIKNELIDENVFNKTGVKCIHYQEEDLINYLKKAKLKIIDEIIYEAYISPNNESGIKNKLYIISNE
jgi:ubiquinone/menaquinone biosynthesis C-methylase UbiE